MADLGGSTYSLRIKAVLDTSQMRQELNRLNGNQSVAGGPGHTVVGGGGFGAGDIVMLNALRDLNKTMKTMNGTVAPVAKVIPKAHLVPRGTFSDMLGKRDNTQTRRVGTFVTRTTIQPKSLKGAPQFLGGLTVTDERFGVDMASSRKLYRNIAEGMNIPTGVYNERVGRKGEYWWPRRITEARLRYERDMAKYEADKKMGLNPKKMPLNPAEAAAIQWGPNSLGGKLQRYTNLYRNQIGMKGFYYNRASQNFNIPKGYGSIVKKELAAMRAERAAASAESSAVSKAARGGGRGIGRLNRGALGIAAVLAADAFASNDYGNKGPLSAKSYFGNIAARAAQGGMVGGMVGGPIGAAVGSISGGIYSIFNQNKQYHDSVKQTEEQADELVALWNESFTEGMRKRIENAKGGKALINEMMTLQSMRADGLTPSEELVSEAAKDFKTIAGKLRKVSPGEFRLHEMQQLGFRPLDFKALSNLGSLGIFTGANEKNASELVGKTAQMVDYLMKIEHNTEQWSVTYA